MAKRLLPLGILLLLINSSNAQIGQSLRIGRDTCSYFGEKIAENVTTFAPDKETEDVISNIVKSSGLIASFEVKAAGVPNAAAVISGGKRFILYDQYFVRTLTQKTGTKWAAISIMAHEIGHHLNGHPLTQEGSRPEFELQADYFSGFILQKMGASIEEARKAMELLGTSTGSSTHPAKHDRLAAITNGWVENCKKDPNCDKSQETPRPQPTPKPSPKPAPTKTGPDSCEYARDGQCDEPDLCPRGTDTTDCRSKPTPSSSQVFCCDAFGNRRCPIVSGSKQVGNSCFCPGQGYGYICQ